MLKAFDNYPHSQDAYVYASQVIKFHIPACKEVIQSCQRFIDDLNRDFIFTYDAVKAEKACKFIENLPHTKGRWAAKKQDLILGGWQKFIV